MDVSSFVEISNILLQYLLLLIFGYLRCVYESLFLLTNSCKVVTRKFPGQQLTVFPVVFPIMKTPLAPGCPTLTGSSAAVWNCLAVGAFVGLPQN